MDLSIPLRDALVGSVTITGNLSAYLGSYPVFTRLPVPDDAPSPLVVVSPGMSLGEEDGIKDDRPLLSRDILIYGDNDTPAKYNTVEEIAFAVRDLFHRQRTALTVAGWTVVRITAAPPRPAPVDDEQTVGRLVELSVLLARQL